MTRFFCSGGGGLHLAQNSGACKSRLSILSTSPGRSDGTRFSGLIWKMGTSGLVGGSTVLRKSGWRPGWTVMYVARTL